MVKPKISVIIPTYNSAQYIERVFKSILEQHYDNFEVICLDDCSLDNTCAIIEQYTQNDKRFQLITHTVNQGPVILRNEGLLIATGDYILFCDSDDWYEQALFEKLADIIVENPNINVIEFRYNCAKDKNKEPAHWLDRGKSGIKTSLMENILLCTSLCNKCWEKKFILDNQLKCCTSNRSGEEIPFCICGILKAKQFFYLSDFGYNWRIHENSLSHSKEKDASFLNGVWDMIDILKKELKRLSLYKEETYFSYVSTILRWHIHEKFSISKSYFSYYTKCRHYFQQHNQKKLPPFLLYIYKKFKRRKNG